MVTTSKPRFSGLILDFFGVLTANMVEVISFFEDRERLSRGTFLRGWADPKGQELFQRLELGLISQADWNIGCAELIGIAPENLMARYLHDAFPAYPVLAVARQARAAGIRKDLRGHLKWADCPLCPSKFLARLVWSRPLCAW
ncbi:hypothetical protein [Streptacidiphilus neutrinimicus]|uniref:hypothetical protein n=1 Tax=Streptacidiphilus neutrinimicus TaxID=105420 RepID=UPI00069352A2|nr:hypothetical protein [Streptacidiphilus neutrinimicus]